jgi:hypothetical protein
VTGVFTGTSLDISGDIDVDGTTNLDVVDIDGAVDMATTLAVAGNVDFNGDLDVDGTTNLDVVDIDGAVDMASTLAVAGVLTGASLDISGDIDVDGTTNLDVVDIDGAVDMASTLTVAGDANFDSNTLFVDVSANNVGIGGVPQRKLYVMDSTNGYNLGLQQTSAYNSGNQSGIVFAAIYDSSSDVTDVASIRGGKENTTDGNYAGNLSFYTRVQGGSDTEHIRITSTGKFVVGDTTALNGAGALGSFVFSGGQGVFISTVSQSTGEVMGFVHQKTSVVGTIAIDSSSTTYNTSSDGRLKEITGDAKGLEIINKLNPVAFNWKVDNKSDEGLIAQEVLDIVPNAVSQRENGYYQMDYSKLVTPLIKAIQEQQALIESLTARITTLEG